MNGEASLPWICPRELKREVPTSAHALLPDVHLLMCWKVITLADVDWTVTIAISPSHFPSPTTRLKLSFRLRRLALAHADHQPSDFVHTHHFFACSVSRRVKFRETAPRNEPKGHR